MSDVHEKRSLLCMYKTSKKKHIEPIENISVAFYKVLGSLELNGIS